MNNQFCNQCGMHMSECICGAKEAAAVQSLDAVKEENTAENIRVRVSEKKTDSDIDHFDQVAMTQDEVVVRKYHIGEFAKGLNSAGKGEATLIITNKRVISKQSSDCFGTSHTSLEELALDSITGVKNYYSQGFTLWRLAAAAGLSVVGLPLLYSSRNFLIGLIMLVVAVYMFYTSRKPSYLFSVYAAATNTALDMGVNLRGKLFNSGGSGIIFQYKPTEEAIDMMYEMGACIMDLKTKGNFAIEKWKMV